MFQHYTELWRVVTLLSRSIGLYPFKHLSYDVSIFWSIYSLLFTIPNFSTTTFIPVKFQNLHKILIPLNFLVNSFCAFLNSFKLIVLRKKLKLLFETLDYVDGTFTDVNYSGSFIFTALFRILLPLSYTFIIGYIRSRFVRYIFWFCLVQVNIVCLQFSMILSFLTSQFDIVNRTLNEQNCFQMLIIHNRLTNASLLLNELFSHQLLLVMFHLIISLIDNITTTMRYITDNIFNDIPIDVALFFLFISYDIYCLLSFRAIIDNCTNLCMKANSFNNRLFKILLETSRDDLQNDELLQLQLLRNQKVEFTACGMFALDYSTYHSALATCFTYLILMVQLTSTDDG